MARAASDEGRRQGDDIDGGEVLDGRSAPPSAVFAMCGTTIVDDVSHPSTFAARLAIRYVIREENQRVSRVPQNFEHGECRVISEEVDRAEVVEKNVQLFCETAIHSGQ